MSLLSNLATSIRANSERLEQRYVETNVNDELFLYERRQSALDDPDLLDDPEALALRERLLVDCRALESLITPSRHKLSHISLLPLKTASLRAALELGIADAIAAAGGSINLRDLANVVSANENKLGRAIRALASEGIFVEIDTNVFRNTRHSLALLRTETGAYPMLTFLLKECPEYAAKLPENMINEQTKHSFDEKDTPFCLATGGRTPFMEYILKSEHADILEKIDQGVVPWLNKLTRSALLCDYPWEELGECTVVDLGCGPGDVGRDVLTKFSNIKKWIFQDLPTVVDMAEKTLNSSVPPEVLSRIDFVKQDYFEPNVSRGDVYFLRGVMRDYDNENAVKVLSRVAEAMRDSTSARLILNEIVCGASTLVPDGHSKSSPSQHIPPRQSALAETANLMAMNAFDIFGGCERTYSEYEHILSRAGFEVTRFFKFRTFTAHLECRLAES